MTLHLVGAPRRFVFLQGLAGPMFTRLGDHLRAQGHAVFRVNFCGGDAQAWAGRPAWRFSEPLSHWPGWLAQRLDAHGVTDVLLFGCRRPLHRAAIAVARARALRVHVFEEGYIRPNWITVERLLDGDAPWLPRDPQWYRAVAAALPRQRDEQPIRVPLPLRAWQESVYHAGNAVNAVGWPHHRTHRPHPAAVEAFGFARRFAGLAWNGRADTRRIDALLGSGRPFFLLPLQLDGDAQIVHHSPFESIAEVIALVMRSFAAHAPAGTDLVIKNHPLDAGVQRHARVVRALARELDLRTRVHYVETGHLPTLLGAARGAVLVNSTVGMSALSQGCPVKPLARPLYDMPGLTSRAPLAQFWRDPEPPDAALFEAVRNTVIHATQVNGDFCTRQGIALAVAGCERMLGERSPLEALLLRHGAPRQPSAPVAGAQRRSNPPALALPRRSGGA